MFSPKFIKAVKIQSLASFWTTIFMALLVAANLALRLIDEYHVTRNTTPEWIWWLLCACAAAVIAALIIESVLRASSRKKCYEAVAGAFKKARRIQISDPSVSLSLETDGQTFLYACFNDIPFALFELGELTESAAICEYVADGIAVYLSDMCIKLAEERKIEKATITYRLSGKPKTRVIISCGQSAKRKGYFLKNGYVLAAPCDNETI